MKTIPNALLAGLALAVSAPSQRLASYDVGPAPMGFAESQPPTDVLTAVLPPLVMYPPTMAMPAVAVAGVPAGDSTFDEITGLHWYSNGMFLAAQPTPTFPPTALPPAPFPINPAALAAIGGPATGIALDPVAGVMWLCSAASPFVIGVAPIPGTPVVFPPFPVPIAAGPLSGLEWDGISGSLFAVSVGGLVQNFAPGGALVAPIVPPVAAFVGPAGDVAIDKSSRLNPAGVRPLFVIGGGAIRDVTMPGAAPMPAASPTSVGLAYLAHPAAAPAMGTCLCPGTGYPTQSTSGPMTSGNGGFSLGLGGLPPGFPAVFAFDTALSPFPVMINPTGCPLGLSVGPTMITALAVAGPTGDAVMPLPLLLPPGAAFLYNQNVTLCPTDPTGLVLSPLRSIYVGGF